MICNTCNKTYKTDSRYRLHLEKCKKQEYICFLCSITLSCKSSYTRHLNSCKKNNTNLESVILKKQQIIQQLEQNLIEKEKQYKHDIERLEKEYNNVVKIKEQELHLKDKENSLIKQYSNVKNSNNKTYNVNITNNFNGMNDGISCEELSREFTSFFSKYPFIVNEKTFHNLLVNSSSIKQNLYVNDQARAITSYYDKDEQRLIKDTKMKNLTRKTIESVSPDLSQQMINFAESQRVPSDDSALTQIKDLEISKSKFFVENIIANKNIDSQLLKDIEHKSYDNLKTIIPNNTDLEKLHSLIFELCHLDLLIFIFSTWEDIGFNLFLSENHKITIDDYEIIINDNKYRRTDFLKTIYSIYNTIIQSYQTLIKALIESEHFNKSVYTQLSCTDLIQFINDKQIVTNDVFLGIKNRLQLKN